MFDADDPLAAEATLHVAADHGRRVREVAAAEAHRASVLRAQIARMEEAYDLLTSPEYRKKRQLTRVALATCRVPVPDWASPGGAYWPLTLAAADLREASLLAVAPSFDPGMLPAAEMECVSARPGSDAPPAGAAGSSIPPVAGPDDRGFLRWPVAARSSFVDDPPLLAPSDPVPADGVGRSAAAPPASVLAPSTGVVKSMMLSGCVVLLSTAFPGLRRRA